ncbi:tetratricopeptide repeat protein [Qiania dongpingensis]|uniref:Tetratricopeptide repeat protein n=1 Tax=Qiania dongpingensis TaxID=2763669 RepID=A0A7G9G405_9FIRM|nr:tetratricopeptide repeat protein [Qiania dongpingensis]QNM05537.1 tetratricopeptide repeat protein [Qiania dongpingensis]
MKERWKKIRAGLLACLCVLLLASCAGGKGSDENKKGLSLYGDGKYEEAIASFDKAIQKDGERAEYYTNKGMAQLAHGDYDGARVSLTHGISLAPEDPGVYRAMGIVYYQEENYEEAVHYFEAALNVLGTEKKQEELRTDICLYKAEAESRNGNHEAAVEDYGTLISGDEKNPEYYFLRGKAYAASGDLDNAKSDFDKVKDLAPADMDYYVDMYLTLEENGRAEDGIPYLETALGLKAKSSEEQRNRGAIQYLLGNYEEARTELEQVKEEERDGNTWIYLGLACEALGDGEAANHAFEQALAGASSKSSVYYQMALCQMRLENYQQALSDAQSGISENDGSLIQELSYVEAACYEYLGDFQTALQKFTAYRDTYGSNEKIDHEIAFLETRQQ